MLFTHFEQENKKIAQRAKPPNLSGHGLDQYGDSDKKYLRGSIVSKDVHNPHSTMQWLTGKGLGAGKWV